MTRRHDNRNNSRSHRSMAFESLEGRELMAAMSLQNGVLYITGDSRINDSAYVEDRAGTVYAQISSSKGVVRNTYRSGRVTQIRFDGGSGDDAFLGKTVKTCVLLGGSGNDRLEGGSGHDTIVGHAGNDVLKGNGGNDTIRGGNDSDQIYGGPGNDRLYGEQGDDSINGEAGNDFLYGGTEADRLSGGTGNDGLFGGLGSRDVLNGGEGYDRFLAPGVEDVWQDMAKGRDALVLFRSWDVLWTDSEVLEVDKGLEYLHNKTRNTALLRLSGGAGIRFNRIADAFGLYGWNTGSEMWISNASFELGLADSVAVHEIAHNWDDPAENPDIPRFRSLSGWQQSTEDIPGKTRGYSDGWVSADWHFGPTANFASDWGHLNPFEDWSTTWESAYARDTGRNPREIWTQQVPGKLACVDEFFARMGRTV